jgi:putative ABC transport system permease protein
VGIDFDVQRRFGRLQFTRGDPGAILSRALARGEVVVSESFARHHRAAVGDSLTLAGRRVRVAGEFYDYSTDAGVVMMDRSLYGRLWQDRVESMALYLSPGADPERVRARLIAAAGPELLLSVTPSRLLRARVLEVFDQTFRITYVLQAIAVLVAVLGVIGTLTAMVLQRRREIGILRATGARRGQVMKMVLIESVVIGASGAVLGCLAGFALAWILVRVINTQYFGWTIRMNLDPAVPASAVLVVVAAAGLAGIGPARLAASQPAAAAVREE